MVKPVLYKGTPFKITNEISNNEKKNPPEGGGLKEMSLCHKFKFVNPFLCNLMVHSIYILKEIKFSHVDSLKV